MFGDIQEEGGSGIVLALKYHSKTVVGHRVAFASGVLHHDISSGNILFSDQVGGGGFLHDLDYSEVFRFQERNLKLIRPNR